MMQEAIMGEINDLLEADNTNSTVTQQVLQDFHRDLPEAFHDVAILFQIFSKSFSHHASQQSVYDVISKAAEEENLSEEQALEIVKTHRITNRASKRIMEGVYSYYANEARSILMLHAFRSYMFAATDLRRMRVVSAMGQMRVEIESVALMNLFRTKKKLGFDWFNSKTDDQGRKFHNQTKGEINRFCKQHELTVEWNLASSAAQHARMGSVSDGLRISDKDEPKKYTHDVRLNFQDFDGNKPQAFIIRALYIRRTQEKLLEPLKTALPEASDPLLHDTRIPNYMRKIANFYQLFEKRHPEFLEEFLL
jgi:hypothetical protein